MLKKIFTNWRVILMLIFLVMAAIALRPAPWHEGVTIRSIDTNSSAADADLVGPKPTTPPTSRERILSINNVPINSVNDYHDYEAGLEPNISVLVVTNVDNYKLTTRPVYQTTVLNETEEIIYQEVVEKELEVNGTVQLVNETVNRTKIVNKELKEIIGTESLGIKVYENPTTNIRKGLDLQGGTRVVLQPEEEVNQSTMDLILSNMKQRLNVYGLSDIVVRVANDLTGTDYIIVEVAGANEEEAKDLLSSQGKFEAKIGNETVFRGGERDIPYVALSSDQAGIDPYAGCGRVSDGTYSCKFRFAITLSQAAAQRMAGVTEKLSVDPTTAGTGNEYLNESIDLYLDDQLVDSLMIGADLKGKVTTDISISGPGYGRNEQEAATVALQNMKRLRTIISTGSLPVKLNIVKTDNLSPSLGEEFIRNSLMVGLFALLGVSVAIFIRYRKLSISIPMVITSLAEVIIIMGFAALVGWNLDLAAIAGIIIVIGTGVDHLIVLTDEVLRKENVSERAFGWKAKIKSAFFIIMAAYFTTFVAMLPLWFAGAGLLKGFAFTTLIGISIGVFITRPAYAAIIEKLLKK